jgi:hypothetical protein
LGGISAAAAGKKGNKDLATRAKARQTITFNRRRKSTFRAFIACSSHPRTIALMNRIEFKSAAMSVSVFFLMLVLYRQYRSFAQVASPTAPAQRTSTAVADKGAASKLGVPGPAVAPRPGTWNYRSESNIGEQQKPNSAGTSSTSIKDEGSAWTVTVAMKFPEGPVTDVRTLDKDTLVLRKESFKHFVHPDQRWKPVAISLDFSGNKVTGVSTNANGQDKPISVDLSRPVFQPPILADTTISMVFIGCLPLAEGYSTTVRDWDVILLKEKLWQLKVTGLESVTVPAGTFSAYKVQLKANDGTGDKQTAWVAKDSRMPVRIDLVEKGYGYTRTEMVP